MPKLSFLLSLTNNDNDYQLEQAQAAETAARRLDISLKIIQADNDPVQQSQQLLEAVQADASLRPDGIILEPAGGTGFPQIAQAAAGAGIGWAVLNHEVDYLTQLRRSYSAVPMVQITTDHKEVGKIQGKQFAALLPQGGTVLYVEGPANSGAAKLRTAGMMQTKPSNIQVKTVRANWTEESAYRTVSAWLRITTSLKSQLDLVGAQDDSMAAGARRAFGEITGTDRERFLKLPHTGCDGLPKTGQAWLRTGVLAATVCIPTNADHAMEVLSTAIRNRTQPQALYLTAPKSMPALEELSKRSSTARGARA